MLRKEKLTFLTPVHVTSLNRSGGSDVPWLSKISKFSIAYKSKPHKNAWSGDIIQRVIITYHHYRSKGVTKIKVWVWDSEYTNFYALKGTYLGRHGTKRWNTFLVPPLEVRLVDLIKEYDTDALSKDAQDIIRAMIERREELLEIIKTELA